MNLNSVSSYRAYKNYFQKKICQLFTAIRLVNNVLEAVIGLIGGRQSKNLAVIHDT